VSVLAHTFEAAGLATVGISLVRGQAVKGRAPRLLHVDFPLGRPLGRPGDAPFQRRVLASALSLLPRTDVPVLVDFPEAIVDEADQPLSCALPPRLDLGLHPAVDEAVGLRPAFDRFVATAGVGLAASCDPDAVPALVEAIARIAAGEAWEEVGLGAAELAAGAVAVRAYYEGAALALAGHVPAARQAESWLYRSTETGRTLRAAQAALRSAEAPRQAWARLVPSGQASG
jgi:hypothetical protein